MRDASAVARGFDWLLAACVLGALSTLLFILVRGGEYLAVPRYALLFVGVPVGVVVGLLTLRLCAPGVVPSATLTLVALALSLLAAEVVFLSHDASVWGSGDLVGDRTAFLNSLDGAANPQPNFFPKDLVRRSGGEEYRSVLAVQGGEILPLSGVSNATVAMCRDSDRTWRAFPSDEHGFANPPGVWKVDRPMFLSVGDSQVQGWCVEPAQSLMGVIRASEPATVNLGVAGNGPLADLALLKEYAAQLRPRIVLWMFTAANDVADLEREKRTPILRGYVNSDHTQGLIDRQAEIDRALMKYAAESMSGGRRRVDWAEVARRTLTLYDVRLRFRVDRGSVEETDLALLRRTLELARNEVEAWGGKLMFVLLPSQRALAGNDPTLAEVQSIVRALQIPLIDPSPAFLRQPDPLLMFQAREGTHYSAAGHDLVAREVLAAIGSY